MTQTQTEADYQIPSEWVNFGDANPEDHGGLWVKWRDGMWNIIQTYHPDDLPEVYTRGNFVFHHYWMEPLDIFVDGKPENGFTVWAMGEILSISNRPFDPLVPRDLPEDETVASYMNWVIENHGEWLVGALSYSFAFYQADYSDDFAEDYWDYLGDYGITPEMA